jgi:capsular exopolysaccharide synthesis family protein
MSKIFDGLKKTEGAIAKLTIDVIGDDAAADNGSAPNGNEDEQEAFRAAAGLPKPQTGERFSFEDSVHGVGMLPPNIEDYHPPEAADWMPAGLQGPDQPALAPAPEAGLAEPALLEHTPNSRAEPAAPQAPSKAIVIRLRAGAPLLPFDTGEADQAAEEYRRIRTRILQHPREPRLMLVSSPAPGDGKSITALNIAGALALNRDARVLLVDMDLRRPTIATLLGVPDRAGAADVLAGTCELQDAVAQLEPFPNLFLLTAGQDRRNPVELLSSPRWKALCEELRSQMTYIVFDGPPVDAVAEYSLLEEIADGVLLVVRVDHTVRPLLYRVIESIPKDKLLGSVINSYKESFFWKQRGEYYY